MTDPSKPVAAVDQPSQARPSPRPRPQRRRVRRGVLLLAWIWCLWLPGGTLRAGADEQALQAGAATSNITPPLGEHIVGGFYPSPAAHVHDELQVRCLVLDDGDTRLALVVCDLLGIGTPLSAHMRELVEQQTGIPAGHVLLAATHTHSATSVLGPNRYSLEHELNDYQRFVAQRVADGVQRAINQLEPARIAWGTAEEPRHVFNRRWHMKPGTAPPTPFGHADPVVMNPGGQRENLDRPAGPVDPEISFLYVQAVDGGRPLSLLACYSLHYVGGIPGDTISADYFAVFAAEMERRLGARDQSPPFVGILTNGASGDVNNIDFTSDRPRRERYERMREVASDVAGQVEARIDEGLEFSDHVRLAAEFREIEVPQRKPDAQQLEWAREIVALPEDHEFSDRRTPVYARRWLELHESPDHMQFPLQVMRIGGVGIATMPGEVFAETGLDFKQRHGLDHAFIVSMAQGYLGYFPPERHFELGGYETWLSTSRIPAGELEKLVGTLLEMMEGLEP